MKSRELLAQPGTDSENPTSAFVHVNETENEKEFFTRIRFKVMDENC